MAIMSASHELLERAARARVAGGPAGERLLTLVGAVDVLGDVSFLLLALILARDLPRVLWNRAAF